MDFGIRNLIRLGDLSEFFRELVQSPCEFSVKLAHQENST